MTEHDVDIEEKLENLVNTIAEKLAEAARGTTEAKEVMAHVEQAIKLIKDALNKGQVVDDIKSSIENPEIEVSIWDCSNSDKEDNDDLAVCLSVDVKSGVYCDSMLSYFDDDYLEAEDLEKYASYLSKVSKRLTEIASYIRKNPKAYAYLGTYRELFRDSADPTDCCSMEIVHSDTLEVTRDKAPSRDDIHRLVTDAVKAASEIEQLSGFC